MKYYEEIKEDKLKYWLSNDLWKNGWVARVNGVKRIIQDKNIKHDSIADIGCGAKLVKQHIPCKHYTGYDLIGEPDVKIDINNLVIEEKVDLILCMGILEYIDAERFIKNNIDRCNTLIASYVPIEINNDRAYHKWINSFRIQDMVEMIGEHINIGEFHYFVKTEEGK